MSQKKKGGGGQTLRPGKKYCEFSHVALEDETQDSSKCFTGVFFLWKSRAEGPGEENLGGWNTADTIKEERHSPPDWAIHQLWKEGHV